MSPPDARPEPAPPPLSAAAQQIWADAAATSWGQDNGRSFVDRIRGLPDPHERIRLCRMFMDRQHASFRALQQAAYEAWRGTLPPAAAACPVKHGADYGRLVDRGEEFRALLLEILDGVGTDLEQAELLTVWVDDGARWLAQLRATRDRAIINALAEGSTPRELARRLQLSKTQIVNVRNRYLHDIESVGSRSADIVYRSCDGRVVYLNERLRTYTGLDPAAYVGRPIGTLGHPDDLARLRPLRDAAVARGYGRFRGELRLETSDGGWRRFEADFRAIRDPGTGAVEVHAEVRPQPA